MKVTNHNVRGYPTGNGTMPAGKPESSRLFLMGRKDYPNKTSIAYLSGGDRLMYLTDYTLGYDGYAIFERDYFFIRYLEPGEFITLTV